MVAPARLLSEARAPQPGAGEQLAQLLGGGVDGERGNKSVTTFIPVPTPRRDQPCDVVATDLGDELVLAEISDQAIKFAPRVAGTAADVMLPDLLPVPTGDIIESQ